MKDNYLLEVLSAYFELNERYMRLIDNSSREISGLKLALDEAEDELRELKEEYEN